MIFHALLCLAFLASGLDDTALTPVRILETPDKPIRDIAVSADGSIFTFDYSEYRIKKFDPAGKFLLEFGGPGTGEGQFTHLTGIGAFGGKLLAVDSLGLLTFDLNGRFLGKTAFPEEVTPNYSRVFEDGRYVGELIVAPELKAVVSLRSPQGHELDRLASHDLKEFFPELKAGEEFYLSDEYARNYFYALGPGGDVFWAASDAVRIFRYEDSKSDAVASETLTPVPLPEADRARLLSRKEKAKPPFFAYVPDRFPLVCHLAVGLEGDLWMYVQSVEKTGFLRYTKEGKAKGFYPVKAEFDATRTVVRIFGNRMYFISGKTLYAADLI